MTIKLVDLLIENVFEATNTDPIYDEYLTNPQTGKNIKVKSALSDKNHPMYQTALAYIKDKAGTEELPDGRTVSRTSAFSKKGRETPMVTYEDEPKPPAIFDTFKSEEAKTMASDGVEQIKGANDKIKKHESLSKDPEKWNSLSEEFKAAAIVGYRDSERSKLTALQSVMDSFALEGQEVPSEVQDDFDNTADNVSHIEGEEEKEAADSEDGKSWTDSFKDKFLDADTLSAFDNFLDAPEQETQGI